MSTGTSRTHDQGMIMLMGRVNASRYLDTEAVHNVVIPTANQKSCWRRTYITPKFQVQVLVLYKSSRMVKAPGEPQLASRMISAVMVPAYR